MFSKVRLMLAGVAVAGATALTACGGGGGGGATVNTTDGIAFAETSLSLKADTASTVNFNNKSSGLQHNWVLVKGGDDVAAQVDEAGQADTTDYVPDDPNVLAHSKLLNGGEKDAVSVPALPAGTYTYLCTFPGHFQTGMKGTLTVQ